MHRFLTPACLLLLVACEKPALHALEDRIAALEGPEVSGGDDTGSGGGSGGDDTGGSGGSSGGDSLSTTVDTIQDDLESTKEALSSLEDQVTTLDEETTEALESLSSSVDTLSDDIESLDTQIEEVIGLLEDQSAAITALEEEADARDASIAALEIAVASLEDQEVAAAGTVVGLMSETIPDGYLACDGRSLAQADYPDLYAVIGDQFGNEDSVSFNLPDLRGEFLRGVDDGAGNDLGAEEREDRGDGTTGDAVGTWQDEDMGSAAYSLSSSSSQFSSSTCGGISSCGTAVTSASLTSGGSSDAEVRPRNISVIWVIKY